MPEPARSKLLIPNRAIDVLRRETTLQRKLEHIEGYAREFVAGLDDKDAVTRATTRLLLSRLADESLSIATIAREMAMSVRTLQTRLSAEGRCFADVLSDVRKSLATKYLRQRYAVEDITCRLGFAEPSVFRKAFKKWTGMTPGAYRESALARNRVVAPGS